MCIRDRLNSAELLLTLPAIPAAGLSVPYDVPLKLGFCGVSLYLQAFVFDPGASDSFAFTPGLELELGG